MRLTQTLAEVTGIDSETPFRTPLRPRWLPPEMATPPELNPDVDCGAVEARTALLVNPNLSREQGKS